SLDTRTGLPTTLLQNLPSHRPRHRTHPGSRAPETDTYTANAEPFSPQRGLWRPLWNQVPAHHAMAALSDDRRSWPAAAVLAPASTRPSIDGPPVRLRIAFQQPLPPSSYAPLPSPI